MATDLYQASLAVLRLLNVVLLALSLIFCFRGYNPKYMRSFPLYCFANAFVEILVRWSPSMRTQAYDLFTIFELIYFSYFMTQVIRSTAIRKLTWWLNGLVLAMALISIVKNGRLSFAANNLALVEAVILVLPCFVYYREMFVTPTIIDLAREPAFWMVSGIMVYFLLLIPTVWFTYYYMLRGMRFMSDTVYSVGNYAQIFSYVLFTYAMLCRKRQPL